MATLATLTLDIEDMLFGLPQVERPVEDTLSTAVTTAADVTWRFTTDTLWRRNDLAEYVRSYGATDSGAAGEIGYITADHGSGTDVTVRRAYKRTSAASPTTIGTATYDETGGAAEDLWTTSVAHGLVAGDQAFFTVAGTGGTGYAANVGYWVASAPLTTTLTLSATEGGAAIAGTGDGTGWTIATPAIKASSVFRRNPLWDRTMIQRAINECVDNDISPECYYRSNRTQTLADGKKRYDLNASDFAVDQVYQVDTQQTAIGTATFDVTGGASEDLWTTSVAHGLAVGNPVRFTAVGTGAEPYAVGVPYWVATAPSTTTLQLSASDSTTVLEGTGTDSAGTWSIASIVQFEFIPLSSALWEVATNLDTTTATQTGRALRLKSWYSSADTLYYTARTHPSSSAISSLPTEIADMIPYGAMARLLTWAAVPARSDLRRTNRVGEKSGATQPFVDAQVYAAKFEEMKRRYKRKMQRELLAPRRYKSNRVWSG